MSEPELLTLKQACERIHVTRGALYMWMRTGKIGWVKTAGGQRRIYADTLLQTPHPKLPT